MSLAPVAEAALPGVVGLTQPAVFAASAASAASVLEAVGLTKTFGGVTVLDDVSLRLTTGSFHALLGENGAGKSTLVKCIMGYYRADAGHVLVRGA
ncbi:MAG: ATP-binding cassette domain-containing protein, partial [Myxococcales bacterium]